MAVAEYYLAATATVCDLTADQNGLQELRNFESPMMLFRFGRARY